MSASVLSTPFDPYLKFALWTGIVAVVLAVCAGGLIVHLRFALMRRTRREQAFVARWRPLLVSALVPGKPPLAPALAADEQVFFLSLWVQLCESIRGPEAQGLVAMAYRVGCDKFSRALLRRGNPAEQLIAIIALGHLRDLSAWALLSQVAHGANTLRSFSALRALVQIDAHDAAQELLPLLLARTDWPLARVAALLQREQAAFAAPLLKSAETAQGKQLLRTLRFVEALRLQLPIPLLRRLLDSAQPAETIIGALRVTLAPALLADVRPLGTHADWRVRVQVAKVLGRLGEREDLALLIQLLSDREWWVRYCAASALIGLPFVGPTQVEAVRLSLDDPFARDILQQAQFEKDRA